MCLGSREGLEEKAVEFLQGILWRDKPVIDNGFPGFPLIEMENGNNIQKLVIIGLRDTMRWKYYKLYPGIMLIFSGLLRLMQYLNFVVKKEKRKFGLNRSDYIVIQIRI